MLSGFLITGILIDTREAANYFSSFYARRVVRIFPLYILSLVSYFYIALPIAHHFGHWSSYDASLQGWYWFHLSNWQSAFGSDIELLTHLWSLAIEEQFYLVWPLVIFLVPRARIPLVCCAVILGSLTLRVYFGAYLDTYPNLLNRLTPFRLDTLAWGGLLAALLRDDAWSARVRRLARPFSICACILLLAVLLRAGTPVVTNPLIAKYALSLFAAVFTCAVYFAYINSGSSGWAAGVLRQPLLTSFGKYSYAIYLLHFPICVYQNRIVMRIAEQITPHLHLALWIAAKIFGFGISYALGRASWVLVESRFLKLKERFAVHHNSAPRPASVYAAGAAGHGG